MASDSDSPGLSLLPAFGVSPAWQHHYSHPKQSRKKEIVALAVVRVSSGYFPVWNVYRTVRKKGFVFLARVRASSQYFPDLDCIPYSCARKRSWISLWLGLAVDIFQFGMYIVQYARRIPCFSLELVLAVSIFQFGM